MGHKPVTFGDPLCPPRTYKNYREVVRCSWRNIEQSIVLHFDKKTIHFRVLLQRNTPTLKRKLKYCRYMKTIYLKKKNNNGYRYEEL